MKKILALALALSLFAVSHVQAATPSSSTPTSTKSSTSTSTSRPSSTTTKPSTTTTKPSTGGSYSGSTSTKPSTTSPSTSTSTGGSYSGSVSTKPSTGSTYTAPTGTRSSGVQRPSGQVYSNSTVNPNTGRRVYGGTYYDAPPSNAHIYGAAAGFAVGTWYGSMMHPWGSGYYPVATGGYIYKPFNWGFLVLDLFILILIIWFLRFLVRRGRR